jgi:8-oxo-dGTP diphosphatase
MKPSVEAVIVRGDGPSLEVLLGRRTMDAGRVAWDLPGGFLNADDHLQDALRRECLREMGVGVVVGDMLGAFEDDFYGSRIVSLVYVCGIVSGEPRAADIIDAVAWFSLDAVPELTSTAVEQAIAALRVKTKGPA